MVRIRHLFRKQFLMLILLAGLGVASTGCGGAITEDVTYLVVLGDSLSVGTEPDASGVNMTTDQGYGETLYQLMLPLFPNLQLVKLGCLNDPGETTVTMVEGGSCSYPEGSQLDAANAFLNQHGAATVLVTIDIGVNDLLQSGCIDIGPPLDVDAACVQDFLENVLPGRMSFIMSDLFGLQSEFGFPVIGLNYYNPFVVLYFQVYPVVAQGIADAIQNDPAIFDPIVAECTAFCSMPGSCEPFPACVPSCVADVCVPETIGAIVAEQAPAETNQIVQDLGIDTLAQAFNFQVIQGVYDLFGFPVSDNYTAFMAGDFTLVPAPPQFSPITMAPVNALAACQLTYMCPDPMSGLEPNIHATDAGYQLMGQTVFDLYTSLYGP